MSVDYLRRNNLIRQYLHRFDERQWPEVVKLTVIFGLHSLKLNEREMQLLTIERLSHLCAQASTAVSIQETLPTLEQTLEQLQNKISDLKGQLECRSSLHNGAEMQSSLSTIEHNEPKLAQILSKVRQLDHTVHEARSHYSRQTVRGLQDPSGSVQKALSASDSRIKLPAKDVKNRRKPRAPPRLAYSVSPGMKPANHITNDVVSSRYLDVPSSDRNLRRYSMPADSNDRGEDEIPVKDTVQSDSTKGNRARTKSAKPKTPTYLQNVRSRIKEQVRQDRIAAAEHRRILRKSIQQAVSDDYRDNLYQETSLNGQQHPNEHSVLKISEAFLKNPLMKPFVGQSKSHDEMDVFKAPTRKAQSNSDLRQAPESVDELAKALRGWINSVDNDSIPETLHSPSDDILSSLKRLNHKSASLVDREDDDSDFVSPFKGPAPPEWDFTNTVFD